MADRGHFDETFLKKLEFLHIVSRKVFAGRAHAERRTHKVGSGIEFADHRDYAFGDDLRYIDWNVYGRMDKLLLRLFEEEEDLYIYILIDCSVSMGFGGRFSESASGRSFVGEGGRPPKLFYAAQLAAALCYIGLANLDRVGLMAFSDEIHGQMPPSRGKGRIFKALDFLHGMQPQGRTRLTPCVREFVHQHKRRGLVVLLSDFYDPDGYQDALNLLRYHRFEPFVVHVYDESEARPSLRGDLAIVDCETGEEQEVTVSPAVLRRYIDAHAEYLREAEEFCTTRNVAYFRSHTGIPFDELILRVFRRGGFLQ